MEFKIHKYQGGGLTAVQPLPFQSYPQYAENTPTEQTTKTAKKTSTSTSPIDESLLKIMIEKGITSDVMSYKEMVDNATLEYQNLSSLEKQSQKGKQLANIISGNDFGIMTRIVRGKELFQQGIDAVKANDASDELAVTDKGMVVRSVENGKIGVVSANEYSKDINSKQRKYEALTNEDVIKYREFNPNMAFDSNSISFLKTARGISGIQKEVQSYLTQLGKESQSTTTNQFVKTNSQQITNAVAEIKDSVENGIFDVKSMVKASSNAKQLQSAFNNIWENMQPASKQLLRARAASQGYKPEQIDEVAKNYIALMIAGRAESDISQEKTIDYKSELSKDSTASEKAGQSEMGFMETLLSKAGPKGFVQINTGSNISYKAPASVIGGYQENGQFTGPISASDMNSLLSIVDKSSISAGDSPISIDKLNSVMYKGGDITNVRLPINVKEAAKGHIIPDHKLAQNISDAEKEIQSFHQQYPKTKLNVPALKSIYKKYNVETTDTGQPSYRFDQFLLFDALVGDEALSDNRDNSLYVLDDSEANEKLFNQKYYYGNSPQTDANKRQLPSRDKFGLFTGDKDLYKATVALRVSDTGVNARLADKKGLTIPKSETTAQYYTDNAPDNSGRTLVNNGTPVGASRNALE